MSSYPQTYIDDCRARIDAQVDAYRAAAASRDAEFEVVFFTNLVLVLELHFVHRLRTKELKDGNPLNEVRLLSGSIMANGGVFTGEKSIRWDPEKSVLKHRVGDVIALREADFTALAKAFFEDLERKFR
ncbi:hypothetical protein ACFFQW_13685 [Umezawaea endophytica]|uniref:Uncharacterized protein n=1 Tax=Umezawaea endophytica TaxID=1654476 RepID=A0A9X2VL65_9PSEU|nr:hypothetical protein [Umezawaea endophytica]MCS7478072.1 hypothetical protein [Umezawaea endophytica]